MRKSTWLVIVIICCTGCIHTPKGMLAWRWRFEAVELPGAQAFINSIKANYNDNDKVTMQRFFLDDKLVLRKDNTFDLVIFQKYLHGSWAYDEQSKMLSLTDSSVSNQPLMMRVDSISPVFLALRVDNTVITKLVPPYGLDSTRLSFFRQRGRFDFFLSADNNSFASEKSDPYSKQNNLWRIKPTSPENDTQLTERVKNHLQFCKVFFEDIVNRNQSYASVHSFRTPLIISRNDIQLRNYYNIRNAWDESFYDTLQAQKGYVIFRNCMKGLTTPEGADRFSGDIDLFGQMIAKLEK